MKFYVANPKRGKKIRKTFRRKKLRARARRSRKLRIVKRVKHCINPKRKSMARRKSRRSRRYKRNAYPMLAVGNPPSRRRRSRRSRSMRRRSRRSYARNPGGTLTSYLSKDIIMDVLYGMGGFASTKLIRDFASRFYPVGLSAQMEGALNVGVEVAGAAVTGMAVATFDRRRARAAAIGGLIYASWTLVGLVTGKPMSLNEYVAPRAQRLNAGGMRRLSNIVGNRDTRLAAYPSALPKAF